MVNNMSDYPDLADIMVGHSIVGNLQKYIGYAKEFKDKEIRDKLVKIGNIILRNYTKTSFGYNDTYATVLEAVNAFERVVGWFHEYLIDGKKKDNLYDDTLDYAKECPYWKW